MALHVSKLDVIKRNMLLFFCDPVSLNNSKNIRDFPRNIKKDHSLLDRYITSLTSNASDSQSNVLKEEIIMDSDSISNIPTFANEDNSKMDLNLEENLLNESSISVPKGSKLETIIIMGGVVIKKIYRTSDNKTIIINY